MHDIRAIRENPDAYVAGWSARGVEDASSVVARILDLDRDLRAAHTEGQEALAGRNAAGRHMRPVRDGEASSVPLVGAGPGARSRS